MKSTYIITLLAAASFLTGCASKETASTEAPAETAAPVATDSSAGAKTAYEGSTGSGLLMERYKSGAIEGFRN